MTATRSEKTKKENAKNANYHTLHLRRDEKPLCAPPKPYGAVGNIEKGPTYFDHIEKRKATSKKIS